MQTEKNKTLRFNEYMNKMPYIIYAGLEYLIKNIDECENNRENFSTTQIGEHIPCGDSMSIIWGIWSCRKQAYFILRKRLYENIL